jgi:hypothetical protein
MFSGIMAWFKFIWKGIDTILGLIFFAWVPIVVSAVFCLLTGIPFLYFWHGVFVILGQCIGELLSYCTLDGFHHMQQWFRHMIF